MLPKRIKFNEKGIRAIAKSMGVAGVVPMKHLRKAHQQASYYLHGQDYHDAIKRYFGGGG